MKFRTLLSALLLATGIAFVAVGAETKPADSPSQVLKQYFAAWAELDFSKIALLSDGEPRKEALRMIGELNRLKQAAQSGDEKAKTELALTQQVLDDIKAGMKKVKIEIKSEKIEGDLAVVEAVESGTTDGKAAVQKCYFKKVGGNWKMIHQKDYDAEKAKASKK